MKEVLFRNGKNILRAMRSLVVNIGRKIELRKFKK